MSNLRQEIGEKPFKCNFNSEVCNKKFLSKKSLGNHMILHTKGYRFPCNVCEKRFCYMHSLRRHMLIHTGDKPFNCKFCSKVFNRKYESIRHMQTHPEYNIGPSVQKTPEVVKTLPREFYICDTTTNTNATNVLQSPYCFADSDLEHLLYSIKEEQKPEISSLSKITEMSQLSDNLTYSDLKLPMLNMTHYPVMAVEQHKEQNVEISGFVNNKQNNEFDMKILTTGDKQKNNECGECGKKILNRDSLRRHVKNHKKVPTKCEECGKIFANRDSMVRHVKTHKKISVQCEECGKTLTNRDSYRRHVKNHKKEPVGCEECGKTFTNSDSLRRHVKNHNKQPVACQECGKTFANKDYLRRHVKNHKKFQ